jgi:hypothetical protein
MFIKQDKYFEEFCNDIFIKYPKLNSFNWTQYTPYQTISSSEISKFSTQILSVDNDDNDSNITFEILNFLNKFEDDFFLYKFGDHSKITINKNEILVQEFENHE